MKTVASKLPREQETDTSVAGTRYQDETGREWTSMGVLELPPELKAKLQG